jgi:alanine racemase
MSALCYAEISLTNLQHNFRVVKRYAGDRKVLAMVKANAYGHGLLAVAKELSSADGFGVARLDEALELRLSGVKKPIVVMSGFVSVVQLDEICSNQLDFVLHDKFQLELLSNMPESYKGNVWIKIDTGMARLGISPADVPYVISKLQEQNISEDRMILTSHLACANDDGNQSITDQIDLFTKTVCSYSIATSICNSGALVAGLALDSTWVRPGIMLYGISPYDDYSGADFDLLPVMTLKSVVIATKKIAAGSGVGYGMTWSSNKDTNIAVIGIGYGDGYPQNKNLNLQVLLGGAFYPVVGEVSMNLIAVDLGAKHQIIVGDMATLWGDGLPLDVHSCFKGSYYTRISQVSTGVQRRYLS